MSSNLPTNRKAQTEPTAIEPRLAAAVDKAMAQLDEHFRTSSIYKRNAPTTAIRGALARRLEVLADALAPAPREAIRAAVAAMMMRFHSAKADEALALAVVNGFADDLATKPLWAVAKACEAFRRGQVKGASLDFPPSLARLVTEVNARISDAERERYRIGRVLAAKVVEDPPVPTAADLARIEKLLADFHADMRAKTERLDREIRGYQPDAERQRALADLERRRIRREKREQAEAP